MTHFLIENVEKDVKLEIFVKLNKRLIISNKISSIGDYIALDKNQAEEFIKQLQDLIKEIK